MNYKERSQIREKAGVILVFPFLQQIKYLRDALDKHLEMSRKKEALGEEEIAKGGVSAASEAELEEAQEQIVKLKSLLATKREQIATLRYYCYGLG